jgi:hypothetical protein
LPDDCISREGGHRSALRPDGGKQAYAYFDDCSTSNDATDLNFRSGAVTHEIIEMATDPEPDIPAWRTLSPGLVYPSVPALQAGVDEAADLCDVPPAQAPDYPFAVSRAYSNRRARAGLDPCGPVEAVQAVAALRANGPEPASIDLSNRRAEVILDIFSDDPSATFSVNAYLTGSWFHIPLLHQSGDALVHDGDALSLNLEVPRVPYVLAPPVNVTFQLCNVAVASQLCSDSFFPISALPPESSLTDGGALRPSADGSESNEAATFDGPVGPFDATTLDRAVDGDNVNAPTDSGSDDASNDGD